GQSSTSWGAVPPRDPSPPSIFLPIFVNLVHFFFLRARFRVRTAARRFISTLRCSGVRLAHAARPAREVAFWRSSLVAFRQRFSRIRRRCSLRVISPTNR